MSGDEEGGAQSDQSDEGSSHHSDEEEAGSGGAGSGDEVRLDLVHTYRVYKKKETQIQILFAGKLWKCRLGF